MSDSNTAPDPNVQAPQEDAFELTPQERAEIQAKRTRNASLPSDEKQPVCNCNAAHRAHYHFNDGLREIAEEVIPRHPDGSDARKWNEDGTSKE